MSKDLLIEDLQERFRLRRAECEVTSPVCHCVNCKGRPIELGPFVFDGVNSIQSDDFKHDVTINFNGDMLPGHYQAYGEWITSVLNAAVGITPTDTSKGGE